MCNVRTLLQVICLSLIVIQTVDSYSFALSKFTRIRRQARRTCTSTEFACKSGECIDEDKECDGIVDCTDASDETNACHRIKCPNYLFRCKYGACINPDLECDGKPDCMDGSDEKTSKCKPDDSSPECKTNEFRCSSGQCIPEDYKCDGKAECKDNSDEIRATCWNVRCPGFTHKCKYGACVSGNAECNGIVECFDGSDEDPAICKTKPTPRPTPTPGTPGPQPTQGGCVLPNHPEFGEWQVYGIPGQFSPGMAIRAGATLRIQCKKRYKLEGKNAIFCENGKWSDAVGHCLKLCPSIQSTSTMRVTCIYNKHEETENCTEAVEGTLVRFDCAPFYEDLGLSRHPIHICRDGSWDQRRPECTPVCGQKSVNAQTLIVNGKPVKKGDYPWQVALYTLNDKELICGGSLLNQRVVLTAAHCITDDKGKLLSKENYMVGVGKYYRPFNDSRDRNEAQFSEVKHMFIPELYKGSTQNYVGDIAILVTRVTFTLSRRVQPVCIDYGLKYTSYTNEFGYVTGWGYTLQNDKPSDVLKELKVPAVSTEQCSSAIPEDYDIYLTHDKLCAGYLDNGTSVCSGDSGGGLVFKFDGRYYVTGIVSLSPQASTGGCDTQQYGLYTKVGTYISDFIIKTESQFRP
jgi:hypothetical protein